MSNFFQELKRRNVIKASLAYLVVSWIIVQVALAVLPTFGAPDWVIQAIIIVMAIGLPIWIVISWVYDITPQGIEKTSKDLENELVTQATNKRLNVFIIASLSIAVIVLTLKLTNVFSNADKQYAIAVLYFDNINDDKADEWFSDGFTIDIYTYLAAVKSLKVISPKSTIKYKDTDKTISEIADELGVDYIVDGNVRKHNNQVLISAYLVKANDEQVWEDDFNESEENPFKIQKEVSQKIVEQLKVRLSPQEEKILDKYPTQNMEAYNLFSKGRLVNDSRKKEDLERNIELNKQAIALDPNFAEAYAEIGQSIYLLRAYYSGGSSDLWAKEVMPYLEKALQLDPNNAMVYGVKGMITSNAYNWEKAKEYFEKAIALNPNSATIRFQYANHADKHGDVNRNIFQTAIGQELDPLSPLVGHRFFTNLIKSNKIEEAEQYFNKYRFLFTKPGEQLEKESILIAYKNKDWEAGFRFLEAELKKDPDNAILNRKLGEAYDGIYLDDNNYIKYTKKAYKLDSINMENGEQYFNALLGGEKFIEAKNLIESENFKSFYSKSEELNTLFWYYYRQKNYSKVQELLKDSLLPYKWYYKLFTEAHLGNKKYVDSIFKIIPLPPMNKAAVYAILKERDSMYIYLGKIRDIIGERSPYRSPRSGLRAINSWEPIDPYRKEERYKALLRKNYLPITHWNE